MEAHVAVAGDLESGGDHPLRVALPRVDQVDDLRGREAVTMATMRRGRPHGPAVGLDRVHRVAHVVLEQAILPEVIGHVLADVGGQAVGAHEHHLGAVLIIVIVHARGALRQPAAHLEHQAAFLTPLLGHAHGGRLLDACERLFEEVRPHDVLLPREEVVVDAEPPGRGQLGVQAGMRQLVVIAALQRMLYVLGAGLHGGDLRKPVLDLLRAGLVGRRVQAGHGPPGGVPPLQLPRLLLG